MSLQSVTISSAPSITRPELGRELGDKQVHFLVQQKGCISELSRVLELGDSTEVVTMEMNGVLSCRPIHYLSPIFDELQQGDHPSPLCPQRSRIERLAKANLLLQAGADLGANEEDGLTALHTAVMFYGRINEMNDAFCLVPPFLAKGANPLAQASLLDSHTGQMTRLIPLEVANLSLSRMLFEGRVSFPDDLWELLELTLKYEKDPVKREGYVQNYVADIDQTFSVGTPFATFLNQNGKTVDQATADDFQAFAHLKVCELKKPRLVQELQKKQKRQVLPSLFH